MHGAGAKLPLKSAIQRVKSPKKPVARVLRSYGRVMKTKLSNDATETVNACIDTCNRLLEGERSAVETYDQVLEKFSDDLGASALRRIRDEHAHATALLEQNILQMGGMPLQDSGVWGMFANAVQKTANLFGENSAITSLQKGEEKGAGDYRAALSQPGILPSCRALIHETLLPLTKSHIESLASLQREFVEQAKS